MEAVKPQLTPQSYGSYKGIFKPAQVQDTRFGIRRINLNTQEKPKAFSYADPADHWWGTR